MTDTQTPYNVKRQTVTQESEYEGTGKVYTGFFKEDEDRAWKWEVDPEEDEVVVDAAIHECPQLTTPIDDPPPPPACDQWYKFGKDMIEQEKKWEHELTLRGAAMKDSITAFGAQWENFSFTTVDNICQHLPEAPFNGSEQACPWAADHTNATSEDQCGVRGGHRTFCSNHKKPYCMNKGVTGFALGESVPLDRQYGECVDVKPAQAQYMHFNTFDFQHLPPACNPNPVYNRCAYTRCGGHVSMPTLDATDPFSTQKYNLALQRYTAYNQCRASLVKNECNHPAVDAARFVTRAADFERCIRARRCGPEPESYHHQAQQDHCQCLTTGYNAELPGQKQFVSTVGGEDIPWGIQSCPVAHTTINGQGVQVSTEDDADIVQQVEECHTRNNHVRRWCDPTGNDVYTWDSQKANINYATCTCNGSTYLIGQGQPNVVCEGGVYDNTQPSWDWLMSADESSWSNKIVKCATSEPKQCGAASEKYAMCKRMASDGCDKYRPMDMQVTSEGIWVDGHGNELDPLNFQDNAFQNGLVNYYKCLLEETQIDKNFECQKTFTKATRNKYYMICFEEGKIAGNSETEALWNKFTENGTVDVQEYKIEQPDSVKYSNWCVDYQEYNGKVYCSAYEYIGELQVDDVSQRKFIYPFVRFWMRQSKFGAVDHQKMVDPEHCTNTDALGYNELIPSDHHFDICKNKTTASMKILHDGMRDNFWMHKCPDFLDSNAAFVAEGQSCGLRFNKYCDKDLMCRSTPQNSNVYTCVKEENSMYQLQDNSHWNWGRRYDNNSIPYGCATNTVSAEATNLEDRCFDIMNDFYYWTHYKYDDDTTHLCKEGQNTVIGASESLDNTCGIQSMQSKTVAFCDQWDKPACIKIDGINRCVSIEDALNEDRSFNYNHHEHTYHKMPWMCRNKHFRLPAEVLNVRDEWSYNEGPLSANSDSIYLSTEGKKSIVSFVKQVQRDCKFDLGFDAKLTEVNGHDGHNRNGAGQQVPGGMPQPSLPDAEYVAPNPTEIFGDLANTCEFLTVPQGSHASLVNTPSTDCGKDWVNTFGSTPSGTFVPLRWYNNESGSDIEVALISPDGGFLWSLTIPQAGAQEWAVDAHTDRNPTGFVITAPFDYEVGTTLVFRKKGGNAFAVLHQDVNSQMGTHPLGVGFYSNGAMLVTRAWTST
jgi:hypothetical protein